MMLHKTYTGRIGGVFFNAFLLGAVTLLICQNIAKAEEVPAFFLKIAKIPTLPRVGRSGKFEDFFYKAEKHIPRIGRNSQQSTDSRPLQDEQETYSGLTKRRIDYPPKGAEEWSWQNFPLAIEGPRELWRTLAGYSRDGGDELLLGSGTFLWIAISYTYFNSFSTTSDIMSMVNNCLIDSSIENEVWQRKKRTGTRPVMQAK